MHLQKTSPARRADDGVLAVEAALVVPLLLSTALVVPAAPAQAAGAEVTVADMAFSPARVKVGLGGREPQLVLDSHG